MNESGVAMKASQESKLSELTSRIDRAIGNITQSTNKLEDINSRLIGAVPECSSTNEIAPCRVGSIGLLEDMINTLETRIDIMCMAVARLNDSNII